MSGVCKYSKLEYAKEQPFDVCGPYVAPTETSEAFLFYGDPRFGAGGYILRVVDDQGV